MRIQIVGGLAARLAAGAHAALGRAVDIEYAAEPKAALAAARTTPADLYFLEAGDVLAPAIASLRAARIGAPVIACGYAPSGAEAARSAGAAAFLTPQSAPEEIAAAVDRALSGEVAVIAVDPAMVELFALVDRVARSEASVLITGESGVGKEVVAQRLHRASARGMKPLVSVNCAAIPDNLLESELFGHERGAFTGAVARRVGKFEEANGSTLLLDEISEMEPRMQAKLLRVLQEKVVDRVGGRPLRVDVRVVATSNRDLAAEVARGAFREDLYFRLNVVALRVPPLRERPEDAVALARHFVARFADLDGLPHRRLSDAALEAVRAAPWPGNVRELQNEMHRAVLLCDGPTIEWSPPPAATTPVETIPAPDPAEGPIETLAAVERRHILKTLARCGGNRTHAAAALGVSVRMLRNRLALYRTPAPDGGRACQDDA